MSGALAATAALRAGVMADHPALKASIARYSDALRAFYGASEPTADLMDALRAAPGVILAAEEIEVAAKAMAKTARDVLATVMESTGATRIDCPYHVVSIADAPRRVILDGPVPDEWMRTPPPEPDKTAIGKALRAGHVVPNATLSNGAPCTLRISAKREIAA